MLTCTDTTGKGYFHVVEYDTLEFKHLTALVKDQVDVEENPIEGFTVNHNEDRSLETTYFWTSSEYISRIKKWRKQVYKYERGDPLTDWSSWVPEISYAYTLYTDHDIKYENFFINEKEHYGIGTRW